MDPLRLTSPIGSRRGIFPDVPNFLWIAQQFAIGGQLEKMGYPIAGCGQ